MPLSKKVEASSLSASRLKHKRQGQVNKRGYNRKLKRPESVTNIYVNLLGVIGLLIAIRYGSKATNDAGNAMATLIGLMLMVLPLVSYDLFFTKARNNPTAGLKACNPFNGRRLFIKLVGLYSTMLVIAGCYLLLPEYGNFLRESEASYYHRYFIAIKLVLLFLLPLAPVYVWWVDRHQQQPEDSYYTVGCMVCRLSIKGLSSQILAEHARSWAVKGFFLPLMFIFIANDVKFFHTFDYHLLSRDYWQQAGVQKSFREMWEFTNCLIFTIDVSLACVGYAMTSRVLDTHIRSVEPTMLGWVVCLLCYPPFWSGLFFNQYFNYNDDVYWGDWLWDNPLAYSVWGVLILLLEAVYCWATVAMGYRFSNLTYRGIITSGPYRYTKHPAYIAKNLSFWLISVPFIPQESNWQALGHCLLLLGVNGVYYLRARTEERHLLNYIEFRNYCRWMDKYGVFRALRRYSWFNRKVSYKNKSTLWNNA